VNPIRCIIVDDDPSVRRSVARIVALEGLTCVEAGSAGEALQLLARHPEVPLVITDIFMPGMDGVAFLKRVTRDHPDVSVVILTGQAQVSTAVECLRLGAVDYMSKPVLVDEMRLRISRALEKRNLVLQNREYQRALESRVSSLTRKTNEMLVEQIQMAGRMLEAKDRYTVGHSQRVRDYAVKTAVVLGYTGDSLEDLKLGAELHDIGKIGTSDTILNKPGPLTEDEFQSIKRHTVDGEEILRPIFLERPAILGIVRSHHEHLDGSGFPDRLEGQAIPHEARIVSVVDAFDAMTTARAYRPVRHPEEAIAELKRASGSQFDPEVVQAFLAAFPNLQAQQAAS